jgi:Flp pilus assembly protein TadG
MHMRKTLAKNQRGAALIEAAVTIPIILLISVAIFEFGRAYQTWQVLTNAAREGARVAIIAGTTQDQVKATVVNYMTIGQLPNASPDQVSVDQNVALGANTASQVTISYPFEFIVLNPVARLVDRTSSTGAPITMSAVAVMRNEG